MIRPFVLAVLLAAASPLGAQVPAGPPSPASVALATDIAGKVLPNGTYERIMGGSMARMMEGITSQTIAAPIGPFLKAAGLPATDVTKLGKTTLKQITDIIDPAYQQRMNAMMPVVMTEMGKVMTRFEPAMRDGLVHAYATRFTLQQLGDIDRFFNTPSGLAYAAQSMTVASDPVVVEKLQAFMPTLIEAMPAIMQKAVAATAGLPKPRTYAMLSAADRARLAQLVGAPSGGVGTGAASPPTAMPHRPLAPDLTARPIGDVARYFGADFYPPAALRAESQGRVVALVSVDSAGKAVSCAIDSSSGSGVLDAETCSIAVDRIAYDPATDHQAHPVSGVFRLQVRWVLPQDVRAVAAETPPAPPPQP